MRRKKKLKTNMKIILKYTNAAAGVVNPLAFVPSAVDKTSNAIFISSIKKLKLKIALK